MTSISNTLLLCFRLERFIDTFGPRPSGSDVLERAIDHVINITRAEDVKDVFTEEVQVRGDRKYSGENIASIVYK